MPRPFQSNTAWDRMSNRAALTLFAVVGSALGCAAPDGPSEPELGLDVQVRAALGMEPVRHEEPRARVLFSDRDRSPALPGGVTGYERKERGEIGQ